MTVKFATAKTAQASSSQLRRRKAITRMANGFDWSIRPELLAQPPNADLHDVGARVEVVTPDLRQKALPADDFAGTLGEVAQQLELARGKVGLLVTEVRASRGQIEYQTAGADDGFAVGHALVPPELDAYARKQLFEGERLRQVVIGAELETA